jgi:hypothetical protein
MSHTAPNEKKHGFSKLFGGSKKHDSTTPSSTSSQPLTQTQTQPDSGYATENHASNPNSSNNVETRQEVAPNSQNITKEDIERDNDLQVQPRQNEDGSHNVMDRRTGAVVTTVTTTTTTTTTTTHGPGRPQETKKEVVTERTEPQSLQQPAGKEDLPPNLTRDSGLGSEFQNESNRNSNVSSEHNMPILSSGAYAPTSATGFTNSNEPTVNTNSSYSQPQRLQDSPPVPERSMARDSNIAPISPLNTSQKHNFSYPSRTGPSPTPNALHGEQDSPIGTGPHAGAMELPAGGEMTPGLDRQPQLGATSTTERMPSTSMQGNMSPVSPMHSTVGSNAAAPVQRQSTLSSLKAAAAGIHGVGETLRGTLNSNIDRRIPGSRSAEQQAAIVQKHDDIAAAGRSEMETQRFHDSVREREKARGVGKVISRKPLSQQGQPGEGGLRVTNQ